MHKFPLTVFFADTDAGGVVYHARYLEFFERARFTWFDSIEPGCAIPDSVKGGYVVAEASIRFRWPAKLGERLIVESSVKSIQQASIVLSQKAVLEKSGEIVCEGEVTVVKINGLWKPESLPAALRQKLTAVCSPKA